MYFLFKVVSLLPLCVLQWIASWIALLLNSFNSSMKRVSSINLKLAYPELNIEQHQALLKKTLKNQCLTYVESIKIWGMPQKYNVGLIKNIFGEQYLTEALDSEKGTIVVLLHLGNWELVNVWLNQYTAPVIMYKPSKNKGIDRFMLEARQSTRAKLVPTDENGVRAIFKHLKQGGLTVILPDHLPKESGGIYADFFGQKALSTTLLSKLASKTQCNVIGISCLRNTDTHFDIHCTQLSENILSKDLPVSVNQLNQDVEAMINVAPEQYIWSYKRFRKVEGEDNIYYR
ncbi:lysophospholipid acyltransferase family protein [Acinetobacter terrestris]|uniref:Lysophospholipid acyltransferase family protein n=1 Tax=Acinetobacter terrestris TaxID=2529843 RepID=A0AAW6URI0_9GAMM|nr:lysophospholipid acyltransferase family protein [Acinetobacter terrestris]MDK1684273.1 lysophospholipid acyltransferase family protein [Acinetobacter terrestris]